MKKRYLILLVILVLLLVSCEEKEEFLLEQPTDVSVVYSSLPYSDYLKLSNPVATITVKDVGIIKIQLFKDIAPNTVNSFIQYAMDGSFDNNEFHRIVPDFVVQGGMIEGACDIEGEMIDNGFDDNTLLHYRGVVSMARVGQLLNSASSQFFIMVNDSHNLDRAYAGFGGVVDGFEVIDYLSSIADSNSETAPVPIIIESITIELNGYEVSERICYE